MGRDSYLWVFGNSAAPLFLYIFLFFAILKTSSRTEPSITSKSLGGFQDPPGLFKN